MTNKEAIDMIYNEDERNHYEHRFTHNDEALTIVLSLATRMAMYEWLWSLSNEKAQELGLANSAFDPFEMFDLDPIYFARVMKAWRENT